MKNNTLKQSAIKMRTEGLSFKMIAKILAISNSTSHLWLKDIKLSNEALLKLKDSQQKGRLKGQQTIKLKAQSIDSNILNLVKKDLAKIKLAPALSKLLCAFLYWGEGEKSKNTLAFTNSDPKMVKLFLTFLRQGFNINEGKLSVFLHLHSYHNQKLQITFWSRVCTIPKSKFHVYNKVNFGKYKKDNYPGCVSVRYHDFRIAKEINYLYNLFADKYGGVV